MIMKKMYSNVCVRACTCARVNSLPRNKRSVGKIESEREGGRETERRIRIKSGGKGEWR